MISDELVVHDPPGLLVPQRGHRHLAGVARLAGGVRLVQVMESVHCIGEAVRIARIVLERPAVLLQAGNRVGNRDQPFELLHHAVDQSTVRPRAVVRHIEMIAAGLGLEAGGAVGRDAVAEPAVGAAKLPPLTGLLRKLAVGPNTVDQNAHVDPDPFGDAPARLTPLSMPLAVSRHFVAIET